MSSPSDPPPSMPAFVKYVVMPAFVGLSWFLLGPVGVVLAALIWFAWYVYEGYAEATMR